MLHVAIKKAVKNEVLARNVVSVHAPPKVADEEIEILDDADVPVVLAKLATHVLGPIADLGLATGCRRGELLALAWACVDLEKAIMKIERSLEETKEGLRFKPPKTKVGSRTLSMPGSTVMVLREHRRKQLETRLALGLGRPGPDALVFCRADGSPITPSWLSYTWRNTCVTLELPRVTFHALRHTHASALISSGMDVVAISKRLGHKSPTTTLRIYAHLFAKLAKDAAAADAIEAVMRGGPPR